jgi:dolichol-phosphate mannosyltransferase
MKKKLISIVVPVYFEEELIAEFYSRMHPVMNQLKSRFDTELIFINDGSKDRSLEILLELTKKDSRVRILDFSRNFGHQRAITAGIDYADGDAVVIIDSDLQDPPEVIPEMIAKWEEGYDVVGGTRKARKGETAFKLFTARIFYRLLNSLSEIPLPLDTGDFRLMDRKVVKVIRTMKEEGTRIQRERYFTEAVEESVENAGSEELEGCFPFSSFAGAANHVIAFFPFRNHLRDDFRWILQVAIDDDHCVPVCVINAGRDGALVAKIAREVQNPDSRIFFRQLKQDFQRSVFAPVIDEYQFSVKSGLQLIHHWMHSGIEFSDQFLFKVHRDYNGDEFLFHVLLS